MRLTGGRETKLSLLESKMNWMESEILAMKKKVQEREIRSFLQQKVYNNKDVQYKHNATMTHF